MTAIAKQTVVLDVMGADSGAGEIILGGLDAALKIGAALQVILVGRRDVIEKFLAEQPVVPKNIEVHHAETEVPMGMPATDGVRLRDSSIAVGIGLVKDKKADAFVSPGNTGAVMATALLSLGRMQQVSRPAIATLFPTSTGRPTVVLDVGANAESKPQHLAQFAVMGSVFASVMLNLESPRVGLISIGEERSKGNELILNSHELLKHSHINFVGNIEGRDILSGEVDVAVTDGFTGNILLKFAESVKPMLTKHIQRQVQTNIFSRIGVFLLLPFLRRMNKRLDYAEVGGAPLLGVNGNVIICHGASGSRAMSNAVKAAFEMSSRRILEIIHDKLAKEHFGKDNGEKNKSQDNRDRVVYAAAGDDQR
ncbi:MAG TPA: phosphate acyltransferase PlsX [candidate division Zixibacteria bacterium]|nr:phosphate acyltransferase PlsX [candidate division Zixibacteria bacterium]